MATARPRHKASVQQKRLGANLQAQLSCWSVFHPVLEHHHRCRKRHSFTTRGSASFRTTIVVLLGRQDVVKSTHKEDVCYIRWQSRLYGQTSRRHSHRSTYGHQDCFNDEVGETPDTFAGMIPRVQGKGVKANRHHWIGMGQIMVQGTPKRKLGRL